MFDQFIQSLAASGPLGIICAILLWRDSKRDERDSKRDDREAEREKARLAQEDRRIDADRALAVSMTLLSERVSR